MSTTKAHPSSQTIISHSDTCAVIPAHNEASSIANVVKNLLSLGLPVLVIDDGSEDNTASIAEASGAEVLRLPANKGKGAAIRYGLASIKGDFQYAILMDADAQHSPADALLLLKHLKSTDLDIVIGNRMHQAHRMPLVRRITNRLMSAVLRILTGLNIADTQCGLKAIRLDSFNPSDFRCNRFDWESELIIRTKQKRLLFSSIPVNCLYNKNPSSKINAIPDTLRFILLILRNILR